MALPVDWPEIAPAELSSEACAILCLATADGAARYLTIGSADVAATRFKLGSVAKLVTALVVSALAREGRLTLDAPLLPSRSVTLRHLLTHAAGLPDDALPAALDLSAALASDWLPPGAAFSYANLGFAVVGAQLEHLTGQPLRELARQAVFAPYGISGATLDNGLAAAAGGLTATAADAARLLTGLLRHPDHLAALLETPVAVPSRLATVAGLGCFQRRRGGIRLVEHEGFTGDAACAACLVPDEGWGYALLTRGWPRRLRRTLDQIEAAWLGPPPAAAAVKLARASREIHARYAGDYANGPRKLRIVSGDDTLYLERQGARVPLVQATETQLAIALPLPDKPSEIVALMDDAGQAMCLYPFGSLRALRRVQA
ncbi:MAG: hypothetical protein CFK52_02110 [Chloracidobacterium sp. CP2_5A]|nr:MAG: hypothetical protein CFK52_02110 [Chloracidobacterium sp. CP2_5A]